MVLKKGLDEVIAKVTEREGKKTERREKKKTKKAKKKRELAEERYAPLSSEAGQRALQRAKDRDRKERRRREKQKEKADLALRVRTLPKLGTLAEKGSKSKRKAKVKALKAIDKYVKKKRQSTWIRALKQANKGKSNWCVPRKGSTLYTEVKKIQEKMERKDSGVTKRNPAGLKKVKSGKKVSKKQKEAVKEMKEKRKKKTIEI